MIVESFKGREFVRHFLDNPISFFKGEGGFFYRDRDREMHMYPASMSLLFAYIDKNEISMDEFVAGFLNFIESLTNSRHDFFHFICNLSAFNRCMFDFKDTNIDLFTPDSTLYPAAQHYLAGINGDYTKDDFFDDIDGVDKGCAPFNAIEKFYPQSGSYALLKARLLELGIMWTPATA